MPTGQRTSGSTGARRRTALLATFAVVALSLVSTGSTPASADAPYSTTIVDTGRGVHTSVALNSTTGYPVVAYQDPTAADLELVVCHDPTCQAAPTRWPVDVTDAVGAYASLKLDGSDIPVIAYYDETNGDLKVAACSDAACVDSPLVNIVDDGANNGGNDVGSFASLAFAPTTGFPVISYYDATDGNLMLAACSDVACGAQATIHVVDSGAFGGADDLGRYASLALNGDLPVISYQNASNGNLQLAVCSDPACAGSVNISVIDSGTGLTSNSLTLLGGLPRIAYTGDADTFGLYLSVCGDETCSSNELYAIDNATSSFASLALDQSGFPLISYSSEGNRDLDLVTCHDQTCGGSEVQNLTITTVNRTDDVGRYDSLAIDASGNPVISYTDDTYDRVLLANFDPTVIDVYAGTTANQPPQPNAPDPAVAAPAASAANLGWPTNMVFNADGDMFFTDRYNHTVRKVAADGGPVTTVAGAPGIPCAVPTAVPACGDGGLATAATLRSPWGIALDSQSNLFIGDYGDHRVRRIDAVSGIITTLAGTGTAGFGGDDGPGVDAMLNYPSGLTVDANGAILVADRGNNRIRKIGTDGTIFTFLGTGAGAGIPSVATCSSNDFPLCMFDQPTDIEMRGSSALPSIPSSSNFFIALRGSSTVLATRNAGTGVVAERIGTGNAGNVDGEAALAEFDQPLSLAYDSFRAELYIADSHNLTVRRYSTTDDTVTTVAGNGTGKLGNGAYVTPTNGGADALATALNFPIGLAFLPSGDERPGSLYLSAVYENQIRKVTIARPTSPPPPPPP